MEVDNPSSPPSTPVEDRRKSGRATRRPEVFSQTTHSAEVNASAKRKRGDAHDAEDTDDDVSESESDEAGDDEADEEEMKAKRRANRKAGAKKPPTKKGSRAAKKPKVVGNGVGRQLAFRPALNGRLVGSRPRKPKIRPSLAAGERGLFGEFLDIGCEVVLFLTIGFSGGLWEKQQCRHSCRAMAESIPAQQRTGHARFDQLHYSMHGSRP